MPKSAGAAEPNEKDQLGQWTKARAADTQGLPVVFVARGGVRRCVMRREREDAMSCLSSLGLDLQSGKRTR